METKLQEHDEKEYFDRVMKLKIQRLKAKGWKDDEICRALGVSAETVQIANSEVER